MDIFDLQFYFYEFIAFLTRLHDEIYEFGDYCIEHHIIL